MQLSVSTTPTPPDSTLAALFTTASGPGVNDASRVASGFTPDSDNSTAFAEMLSDVPTPVNPATKSVALSTTPLAGSNAAASRANFPRWLVTEATASNPIAGAGPAVVANATPAEVQSSEDRGAGVLSAPSSEMDLPARAACPCDDRTGSKQERSSGATNASGSDAERFIDLGRVDLASTLPVPTSANPTAKTAEKNVHGARPTVNRADATSSRAARTAEQDMPLSAAVVSPLLPTDFAAPATPIVAPDVVSAAQTETAGTVGTVSGQAARGAKGFTPPTSIATVTVGSKIPKNEIAQSASPSVSQSKGEKSVCRTVTPATAEDVSSVPPAVRLPGDLSVVSAQPENFPDMSATTAPLSLSALPLHQRASVPVGAAPEAGAFQTAGGPAASPILLSASATSATHAQPASFSASEFARSPTSEVVATFASEIFHSSEQPASKVIEGASAGGTPVIQFENSIPTRAEIFAALDGKFTDEKKSAAGATEKTFLSPAAKRVATHDQSLGIDVAKRDTAMPAATFTDRPSFVAPLERASAAPVATPSASSASPLAAEPTAVAHRAVDAVLTAVERFSGGDRHSVQMQFSVGGTDLSVRVELRGDEVRTTFRTDSPELRSALAHEWQAAGSDTADHPVRLASPVFSSNDSTAFSAFSGDTASRQRDARARRDESDDLFAAVAARSRSATAFGSSSTEVTAPAARTSVPGTALHLSTHA